MAKAFSDHHFYNASAKSDTAGFSNILKWLPWSIYFLIHLVSRISSLAFLMENFVFLQSLGRDVNMSMLSCFNLIAMMVIFVIIYEVYLLHCQLRAERNKLRREVAIVLLLWRIFLVLNLTRLDAIWVPITLTYNQHKWAEGAWKLHKFNCLTFAIILTSVTVIQNSLSANYAIHINTSNRRLSEYALDLNLPPFHPKIMANAGLIWIGATVLFNIVSFMCLQKWGHNLYAKMESDGIKSMERWITAVIEESYAKERRQLAKMDASCEKFLMENMEGDIDQTNGKSKGVFKFKSNGLSYRNEDMEANARDPLVA